MKEVKEFIRVDKEIFVYISDDGKVKNYNSNRVINYEHSQRFKSEDFYKKYKKQYLSLNDLYLDVYYISELNEEVNLDFNNFYEHNATCGKVNIEHVGWIGIEVVQSDYTTYYVYKLEEILKQYKSDIQKLENIINE